MLYTGKGDNGTTKLYGSTERTAKDDARIALLGDVDELNSFLGYCRALACGDRVAPVRGTLLQIQEDLFIIQAFIAGAPKSLAPSRLSIIEEGIAAVEHEIGALRSFIIPGSTVLSGALDVARTIARRTERSAVALHDQQLTPVIPYLNRLSSALFALARLAAHRTHVTEKPPSY